MKYVSGMGNDRSTLKLNGINLFSIDPYFNDPSTSLFGDKMCQERYARCGITRIRKNVLFFVFVLRTGRTKNDTTDF